MNRIPVLMVCVLLCSTAWAGPSSGPSDPESQQAVLQKKLADTIETSDVGRRIPAKSLRLVISRVRDVVDYLGVRASEERQNEILKEIPHFLGSMEPRLSYASADAASYWITFVIATALNRPDMDSKQKQAASESDLQFLKNASDVISTQIKAHLHKNASKDVLAEVDTHVAKMQESLQAEYERLRDDELFPVFKEPLSRELQDKILEKLKGLKGYDDYVPSKEAKDSKDPSPDSVLTRLADYVVFEAIVEELDPLAKETSYWGTMDVTTVNTSPGADWPVSVHMFVAEKFNEGQHWKRAPKSR